MTTAHASCLWAVAARFTEHGQLGIVTGYRPASRGVDPYGTGGTCPPNIYEGGVIHGNVPPIF